MNPLTRKLCLKCAKLLLLFFLCLTSSFFFLEYSHSKSSLGKKETLKQLNPIGKREINANTFANGTIWSQPYQLTMPAFQRGDFIVVQDSAARFHCVFIKQQSLYGYSLNYLRTTTNQTNRWTIPKQFMILDSTIEELQLAIDQNDTLYLAFISRREEINQIEFLTKEDKTGVWSNISILSRSMRMKYSSLTMELSSRGFIEIAWISRNVQTTTSTSKSYVNFVKISLATKIISEQRQLFQDFSPQKVRLKSLYSKKLIAIVTTWDQLIDTSRILWAFTEDGFSWSNLSLLDSYSVPIDMIEVYSSNFTGGFHLLWTAEDVSKELAHLEVFENGSIRTPHVVLNNPNYDAFIVGLGEDNITGNLFVFYEEVVGSQTTIYYKKRSGGILTWQISQTIASGRATNGLFIPQTLTFAEPLGELFYFNFNKLVSVTFNTTALFSAAKQILFTTVDNNKCSMITDNNSVLHFVWEHNGVFNSEIYYQRRFLNGSWGFIESITQGIIDAKDPKLLLDSNNTLYCFFIADDVMSSYDGLFYTWKNYQQDNWSNPILVKEPENYAEDDNYAVLIDSKNTIHIVWAEQMSIYQNRLFYSFKTASQQNFSSMVLMENNPQISAVTPNLVIDSLGNLHLTYTIIDRNVPANYIKYRTKTKGENWSDEVTLDVATDSLLVRPLQVVDSQDTLQVIFLKKFYDGPYLVSDSIFLSKKLGSTWKRVGAIFEHEMTNFHYLFTLENDTLLYLQHITNLPIDSYPEGSLDFIVASTKIKGQDWSQRELLFDNPTLSREPRGIFDSLTKNVFVAVHERRGAKTQLHLISRQKDTDNDMLGDFDEEFFNTNPLKQDSDQDNIVDGVEVANYKTSPTLNDTDWDNLTDGLEILAYHSDPLTIDSDLDGLFDGEEALHWLTNPTNADSDDDELSDFEEIFIYFTNPNNNDTDYDGMPDAWEIFYALNPLQDDSYIDLDNDLLTNVEEFSYGTNPKLNDTDTDGLLDGSEVKNWLTDPLNIDTDADTISDADEVLRFGTNPLLADSDGDGFTDREEINAGTDPLKKSDNPLSRKVRRIVVNTFLPIVIIGITVLFLEIRYQRKIKQLKEQEKNELIEEERKLETILQKKQKK